MRRRCRGRACHISGRRACREWSLIARGSTPRCAKKAVSTMLVGFAAAESHRGLQAGSSTAVSARPGARRPRAPAPRCAAGSRAARGGDEEGSVAQGGRALVHCRCGCGSGSASTRKAAATAACTSGTGRGHRREQGGRLRRRYGGGRDKCVRRNRPTCTWHRNCPPRISCRRWRGTFPRYDDAGVGPYRIRSRARPATGFTLLNWPSVLLSITHVEQPLGKKAGHVGAAGGSQGERLCVTHPPHAFVTAAGSLSGRRCSCRSVGPSGCSGRGG